MYSFVSTSKCGSSRIQILRRPFEKQEGMGGKSPSSLLFPVDRFMDILLPTFATLLLV